ncbi:hypothetical protein K493DRAFT_338607 [Basidiobolus meristosporus CBS 931.73]|uniref:Uncharacterized protein n=1 Tax=Basidiobolus meristosporus CBS 931.73 TaxID=1314790 RepID=A0A1Y1Y483_9FUNG|nr:hypothetical protein K493DRAFT_338607 [Basidiobolus meristosporus CBS 931.73]|eukprot:ORX92841.1 hypothetical protein K493DRAFT_338607 [Basidiobolus meristosporus CBS 931.73]
MNFHKQLFKKKLPAPPERRGNEVGDVAAKEDEDYYNSLFTEEASPTPSHKLTSSENVYFSVKTELPPSPTAPASPTDTKEGHAARESVESLPIATSTSASEQRTKPATLQISDELETCSITSEGSLSSYDSPKISMDSRLSDQLPSPRRSSHHEFSWSPLGSLKNKLSRALHHVTPTNSVKVNIEDIGATSDQRVHTYLNMHKVLQERETGLASWLCHVKSQSRMPPEASRYFKPHTTAILRPSAPKVVDTISVTSKQPDEPMGHPGLDSMHSFSKSLEQSNNLETVVTEAFKQNIEEAARAYITPPLDENESEPTYIHDTKQYQERIQVGPGSENPEASHHYSNSNEANSRPLAPTSQLTPNGYDSRQSRPLPIPKSQRSNNSYPPAAVHHTPPTPSDLSSSMGMTVNIPTESGQAATLNATHPSPHHQYYPNRPMVSMVAPYPPLNYSVYGPSAPNSPTSSVYPPEGSNVYPSYPASHYQSRYMMSRPLSHENWIHAGSPAINPAYPTTQQYSNPMFRPQTQLSALDAEAYTAL